MKTAKEINVGINAKITNADTVTRDIAQRVKKLKSMHALCLQKAIEIEAIQSSINTAELQIELRYLPLTGKSADSIDSAILSLDTQSLGAELSKKKAALLAQKELDEMLEEIDAEAIELEEFIQNTNIPGPLDLQPLEEYSKEHKRNVLKFIKYSAFILLLGAIIYFAPSVTALVLIVGAVCFLANKIYQRLHNATSFAMNTIRDAAISAYDYFRQSVRNGFNRLTSFQVQSQSGDLSQTTKTFLQDHKLPVLHSPPLLGIASTSQQTGIIDYFKGNPYCEIMPVDPTKSVLAIRKLHRTTWQHYDNADALEFLDKVEKEIVRANICLLNPADKKLYQIIQNYLNQLRTLAVNLKSEHDDESKTRMITLHLALAQTFNTAPELRALAFTHYPGLIIELDMLCGINTLQLHELERKREVWHKAFEEFSANMSTEQRTATQEERTMLSELYEKSRYNLSLFDSQQNIRFRLHALLSLLLPRAKLNAIENGTLAKQVKSGMCALQTPLEKWQQSYMELPESSLLTESILQDLISRTISPDVPAKLRNHWAKLQNALSNIADNAGICHDLRLAKMLSLLNAYAYINREHKAFSLMLLPIILKYKHLFDKSVTALSTSSINSLVETYAHLDLTDHIWDAHHPLIQRMQQSLSQNGNDCLTLSETTDAERKYDFYKRFQHASFASFSLEKDIKVLQNNNKKLAYHIKQNAAIILSQLNKSREETSDLQWLCLKFKNLFNSASHKKETNGAAKQVQTYNDLMLLMQRPRELRDIFDKIMQKSEVEKTDLIQLEAKVRGFIHRIHLLRENFIENLMPGKALLDFKATLELFADGLVKMSENFEDNERINKEVLSGQFQCFLQNYAGFISAIESTEIAKLRNDNFDAILLISNLFGSMQETSLPSCYHEVQMAIASLLDPDTHQADNVKRLYLQLTAIMTPPQSRGLMVTAAEASPVLANAADYANALLHCAEIEKRLFRLERLLNSATNQDSFLSDEEKCKFKAISDEIKGLIHSIQDQMQDLLSSESGSINLEDKAKDIENLQEKIGHLQTKLQKLAEEISPSQAAPVEQLLNNRDTSTSAHSSPRFFQIPHHKERAGGPLLRAASRLFPATRHGEFEDQSRVARRNEC